MTLGMQQAEEAATGKNMVRSARRLWQREQKPRYEVSERWRLTEPFSVGLIWAGACELANLGLQCVDFHYSFKYLKCHVAI